MVVPSDIPEMKMRIILTFPSRVVTMVVCVDELEKTVRWLLGNYGIHCNLKIERQGDEFIASDKNE